jgi:hypothetical protein
MKQPSVMVHRSERQRSTGLERRASPRYRRTLVVRYKQPNRPGPPETGRIIDLSRSGWRFTAERPLQAGLRLDVFLDWPVLLDGGVQLRLIAWGVVAWTNGTETALRIERREYRTRRVE